MKKEVKIMKYRLNWTKFAKFVLILLAIVISMWFLMSYIEVVLKNTTKEITYSDWNILIKIFGK